MEVKTTTSLRRYSEVNQDSRRTESKTLREKERERMTQMSWLKNRLDGTHSYLLD